MLWKVANGDSAGSAGMARVAVSHRQQLGTVALVTTFLDTRAVGILP